MITRAYGFVSVGAFVGYSLLVLFTLIFTLPIAARLTALAGSPPVNSANTDAIYSLIGLLVGLAFGAMPALGPASRNSGPRRATSVGSR